MTKQRWMLLFTTLLDGILHVMQHLYDPGIYQALQMSVSLGKCI